MVDLVIGDIGDIVKVGYRILGEEIGKEVIDYVVNFVRSKDIESFINVNEKFEFGGKVIGDGGNCIDGKSSWGIDVVSSRGDID